MNEDLVNEAAAAMAKSIRESTHEEENNPAKTEAYWQAKLKEAHERVIHHHQSILQVRKPFPDAE